MSECDGLGEVLVSICFRLYLSVFVVLVDRLIIQRRESIIRWIRKTQDFLRLPECLRVWADIDPGMLEEDVRIGAEVLFGAGLFFNLGLLILWASSGPATLSGWIFWFGIPACMVIVMWVVLALRLRRRLREPMPSQTLFPSSTILHENHKAESKSVLANTKRNREKPNNEPNSAPPLQEQSSNKPNPGLQRSLDRIWTPW